MICIDISNQRELEVFAKKLGQLVNGGDILCMTGDLGAGKTTFTQAFAKGLGVEEYVTSPTFTLIHEYDGRIPLYHFDVYRINHVSEMEDLGYEEYFYGNGVCVIEWASLIEEILPDKRLWIEIKVTGLESRQICFTSTNDYYEEMIKELLAK
ncbi:tRNA (adenosine(37)-N6)-threonylcarbamoyltransferase complex ATPase subunit type 1 TsaE [Alkaliphilus sp. B6464]|uniref:tRNA (adenosine(37)-N6)-threonylcarbamoyltransferase complex ATPase subunit type 1 TsaE n=1 Tax=Alkaliphilus sp. B6464 TaxID=2731219 RepID=UPI001BAA073B|nr:tRNA (adenosine(37)-N6)-threonylcarbamoyltransferase complex ATPase subunit type 1 TsaE [Alkaliphilus sp. B6464]QUH18981.1 tRNA (adenosine(37)-N6)-threonylcarbamoyltransferase complex ATPase subunit type 1 TsaE [Alkaliphilus sp. B6464]